MVALRTDGMDQELVIAQHLLAIGLPVDAELLRQSSRHARPAEEGCFCALQSYRADWQASALQEECQVLPGKAVGKRLQISHCLQHRCMLA